MMFELSAVTVGFLVGVVIGRWRALIAGPLLGVALGYGVADEHTLGPGGMAIILGTLFTIGISLGVLARKTLLGASPRGD